MSPINYFSVAGLWCLPPVAVRHQIHQSTQKCSTQAATLYFLAAQMNRHTSGHPHRALTSTNNRFH